MRKAPLGKNEVRKSLSIKAKNAGLQLEGKRVTNHSCQENLYFKAPRCRYSEQLGGPTKKEFTRSRILQSYMQSASYNHQKRRSMILSRVDRSESRDESISIVQNQEYQVATHSTAAIASTVFYRSRFCRCKRKSITGSTFQIFHGDVKIIETSVHLLSRVMRTTDFTANFLGLNSFPQQHFLAP